MRLTKIIWVLPLVGILAAPVAAQGRHSDHRYYDRIENRLDRQYHRVDRGIRSGQLTRREAKRLHRQQRRITQMQRRFLHDGHLDRYERDRLEQKLDRASERIYRLKHNDRYRDHGRFAGRGDRHRSGHGRHGVYGSSYRQDDSGWGFALRLTDHF